jgi:hypothetical protein
MLQEQHHHHYQHQQQRLPTGMVQLVTAASSRLQLVRPLAQNLARGATAKAAEAADTQVTQPPLQQQQQRFSNT